MFHCMRFVLSRLICGGHLHILCAVGYATTFAVNVALVTSEWQHRLWSFQCCQAFSCTRPFMPEREAGQGASTMIGITPASFSRVFFSLTLLSCNIPLLSTLNWTEYWQLLLPTSGIPRVKFDQLEDAALRAPISRTGKTCCYNACCKGRL